MEAWLKCPESNSWDVCAYPSPWLQGTRVNPTAPAGKRAGQTAVLKSKRQTRRQLEHCARCWSEVNYGHGPKESSKLTVIK